MRPAGTGRPEARLPRTRPPPPKPGRRIRWIWYGTQPIGQTSSVLVLVFFRRGSLLRPHGVAVIDLVPARKNDFFLRVDVAIDDAVLADRADNIDVDSFGVALVDLNHAGALLVDFNDVARHDPALKLAHHDPGLEILPRQRPARRDLDDGGNEPHLRIDGGANPLHPAFERFSTRQLRYEIHGL